MLTERVVHQSLYSQCKSLQNKGHSVRVSREVWSGRCETVYGQTVDLQKRQAMLNRVPAPSIVHQCLEKHARTFTQSRGAKNRKNWEIQGDLNQTREFPGCTIRCIMVLIGSKGTWLYSERGPYKLGSNSTSNQFLGNWQSIQWNYLPQSRLQPTAQRGSTGASA